MKTYTTLHKINFLKELKNIEKKYLVKKFLKFWNLNFKKMDIKQKITLILLTVLVI